MGNEGLTPLGQLIYYFIIYFHSMNNINTPDSYELRNPGDFLQTTVYIGDSHV
jgi:hypothetical protein